MTPNTFAPSSDGIEAPPAASCHVSPDSTFPEVVDKSGDAAGGEFLFDLPESKSPRLLWMEKHGVVLTRDFYDAWEDKTWPHCAYVPHSAQGFGNTEHDALVDLAVKLNLPLWNQS